MRQILIIFMIIFILYFIYAFIFSVIIYAFKNPLAREELETFSGGLPNKEKAHKDRVQLIESTDHAIITRLQLIESAQTSVDLSYFTFRNGQISRMLLGSVLDAANRGVKVRILLDGLSILASLTREFKDILYGLLAHENINIKFYDPVNPFFPFNWNKRLHDKMILIDDDLALIGGRNIADNYYMKNTKWLTFSKDRDVLIVKDQSLDDYSSVIKDMKDYYEDTWNYKYAKPFTKRLSKNRKHRSHMACQHLKLEYEKTKDTFKKELISINWHTNTIAVDNIEFIHNPVGKINQDPWCLRELLFLSSQARESIFMQSPYIIPTRRMKAIFKQYPIDLEKTSLLTNSYYSSPNFLSIAAYSRHRKKMLNNKISIHEYQGKGSLHGKTYIFDDYVSLIGSFNLDARSSYINSEIMVAISSKEFAIRLKKDVQVDLDQSLRLAKDFSYIPDESVDQGQLSKTKQAIILALSKITPILEHLL